MAMKRNEEIPRYADRARCGKATTGCYEATTGCDGTATGCDGTATGCYGTTTGVHGRYGAATVAASQRKAEAESGNF